MTALVTGSLVMAMGAAMAPLAQRIAEAHTGPAAPAPAVESLLCEGSADQPLILDQPVGSRPAKITGQANAALDDCVGGDGTLRSATVTMTGTGTVSCTDFSGYSVRAEVTWFDGPDQTGRQVGVSTLVPEGPEQGQVATAATLVPAGRVLDGPLESQKVTGGAVITPQMLACSDSTVRTMPRSFWLRFEP
ncbi:hypothetical protein [Amycolatopsis magusensis]|uniref:hypothetical protein n=1 Tax=Amycolatopsis magusensis TaxID=882444 RepID=UPI0024A99787|nr:hypothetical protein [Amycolatopsis magusensis]MDI5975923.1 hypothetical protein [Amycolatopsis magusensis]